MLIIAIIIIGIYFLHPVLVPLLLALLLSILLSPVVVVLNYKLKFPHIIAVFITLILAILIGSGIIFIISQQISSFLKDIPNMQKHLNMHYYHMQDWIYSKFNIEYSKQNNYIEKVREEIQDGDGMIAKPLDHFSTILIDTVLIPVYTFFIILYRNLFINFLTKIIHTKHHPILKEIIIEIKAVIHSYIVGLLLEMAIVTTLVSTGLMIIGVDYAIFIGVTAGILNLVPYLGILTTTLLSLSVAIGNSSDAGILVSIVILFLITHLIDANILIPKVVSSKVKINALAAILGIVFGGFLIGIPGMFLALPVIAITKVVLDRVPGLEPWGYLLGDIIPKEFDWCKLKSN
ncbi:MAG TPA: AI-2E family transporter [Bacteroidia bacterium]|nr:AI-2E family transporter [Bacteroidia bacterium]